MRVCIHTFLFSYLLAEMCWLALKGLIREVVGIQTRGMSAGRYAFADLEMFSLLVKQNRNPRFL